METRIIVCGGVDFDDYGLLKARLDELLPKYENVRLISGHARGADSLGERYAGENGFPIQVFPAEWKKYGRAAGPIRNRAMLKYAKEETPVVVAFWNGKSRGTANMLKQAKSGGAECVVYLYEQKEKKS